jgi:hypothetical protein
LFRIKRFHEPGAILFRLKFLLMLVELSVPKIAPVTVKYPVLVRVTADPLKPVPVTVMVCHPLFAALVGAILEMVGMDIAATVVIVLLIPVVPLASVAVTVYAVPATVLVVNVTVAIPAVLVVLVDVEKLPPVPVYVHVTTFPAVAFATLASVDS